MKRFIASPPRALPLASLILGASALASPAAFAQSAPAPAASTSTAAVSSPSPTASVLTADAVQEAFVRVANRVRASVVSIEASRNPRESSKDKDKPGSKPAPGAKPDPKAAPNSDEDADAEDEAEDEEPGANPFGMPFGPRDPRDRRRALGTGMVISQDGLVLTNYHVVKGAAFIRVLFDPDSESSDNPVARLIGYDEEADLAVLKLTRAKPNLQPVVFADSDAVRIGEWALAIGSPFQQAQSVTVGVVSAKSRHLESREGTSLQDYIQTDASINPGNSGGPLFNLDGKVIGINTAILSPSRYNVGIGFSVPSKTVLSLLPTLSAGQPVERGFIGISYMKLNPGVAGEFGVASGMHIGALATDDKTGRPVGPAKEAGLQVDDIITHVDGEAVNSVEEFRRLISGQKPGTTLALRIARPVEAVSEARVETREIALKLGARPGKKLVFPRLKVAPTASALGLEVQDAAKLSSDERELFDLGPNARGVVVSDVVPGSSADEAEVIRGLRIVRARVNGGAWQPVVTKAAFDKLQASLAPGSRLLLQLRDKSDTSVYNLIVTPPKSAANVS